MAWNWIGNEKKTSLMKLSRHLTQKPKDGPYERMKDAFDRWFWRYHEWNAWHFCKCEMDPLNDARLENSKTQFLTTQNKLPE